MLRPWSSSVRLIYIKRTYFFWYKNDFKLYTFKISHKFWIWRFSLCIAPGRDYWEGHVSSIKWLRQTELYLTAQVLVVCFCLKSERQAVMATHGFILVLLFGWTVYQVSGKFSQCSDYSWYKMCSCFCVFRSRRHTFLFASAILSIRSLGQCVAAGFIALAWYIIQWLLQRSAARSAQRFEPKSYSKEAKTRRIKGAIPATVDTNAQTITFRSLLSGKLIWCARATPSPPAMLTFAFVKQITVIS